MIITAVTYSCYGAQNDQITSAVFQWPLECVLFQTLLEFVTVYTLLQVHSRLTIELKSMM